MTFYLHITSWICSYSSAISALSSALSSSPSRITSLRATWCQKRQKIEQKQKSENQKKSAEMWSPCPHLLVFAVRLLSDVFGLFELHLLDLHLLLIFHGSVLNHLHASEDQKDGQTLVQHDHKLLQTAPDYMFIFCSFKSKHYADSRTVFLHFLLPFLQKS